MAKSSWDYNARYKTFTFPYFLKIIRLLYVMLTTSILNVLKVVYRMK